MRSHHSLIVLTAMLATTAIAQTPPPGAKAPAPSLLIVAPRAFHEALGPYVEHKRGQLPTELVSLEGALQAGGAAGGVDDPERLKRYLYSRWHGLALRYVLLVGDADLMPVRYMVLDSVTAAAFDYAFYPCDLYYADLARPDGEFDDWNAEKEGFHALYFGEVRGEKNKEGPINFDKVDYRPDIALGRWPVSTAEEVRTVAAKSIAFEKAVVDGAARDGAGEAGRRAAFIAAGGWMENRPAMDAMAAAMPPGWKVEKRYWGQEPPASAVPPGVTDAATTAAPPRLPPDEAQVLALLNEGVTLVVHSGHGADDRWEGSISVRSIAKMHNKAHPAIMLSAGCSTARLATLPPYEAYVDVDGKEHAGTNAGETFTSPPPPPAPYQHGKFNPTGLGEQILRAGPTGAAAYIGCNTGSQPCGMTLLEGFVDALGKHPPPRLGDCWSAAVSYYYDHQHLADLKPNADWYPPSIFFQGMKFMLFGDPSLRIPTERTPQQR